MIKDFKCKETRKIFKRLKSKKLPPDIQRTAMKKLWMIDAAHNINDLRIPPSNRLEQLSGNRKGQYSIQINKKWRICFTWSQGNAYNTEITDYH